MESLPLAFPSLSLCSCLPRLTPTTRRHQRSSVASVISLPRRGFHFYKGEFFVHSVTFLAPASQVLCKVTRV